MATSYTSLLGLALPVTGELSGTWGDTVNNAITSLLDSAVAGTTTLSTDGDVTLTTTTGAANQAREAILLCSGARTALRTITAPAQSKIYTIINATTGGYSVKVVGAGPTTGVTIVAGESAVIAWNGSDFIKISNTGGAASFTNVTVSGTTTLSGLTASTALALNASKEVVSVTNTGTGNNVLSASPTLTGTVAGASLSLSSLTSGRVTYAGTAGLLQDSANLTFDGTTLTANALTTTSTVTINGGTANGVAYLNGSKVLTTGSALTFDGTTLTSTASAATAGNFKATSSTAQVINVTASNDANTTVGLLVLGSAAGSLGMLGAGAPALYTAATELNLMANNASGVIKFAAGGNTEQMRLTSTGLGIGTSSPVNKLQVAGRSSFSYQNVTNGDAGIDIVDSGNNGGNTVRWLDSSGYVANITQYSSSHASLAGVMVSNNSGGYRWNTLGTERARIDSSGNVGIGTSSPIARLTVSDSTATNGTMTLGNNASYNGTLQYIFSTGELRISQVGGGSLGTTFYTNGSERLRLDSSGNVGIGTSTIGSAGVSLSNAYNLGWSQGSGESIPNIFRQASSAATVVANGYRYTATANGFASSFSSSYAKCAISCGSVAGAITFYTDTAATTAAGTDVTPTERARIDSSGNFLFGAASTSAPATYFLNEGDGGAFVKKSTSTSTRTAFYFYINTSLVGSISTSGSSTSYATSSDYRLKENIQPMTGALAFVRKQRPVTYKWKADGSEGAGYIAHWMQEDGAGNCVTGEKDAVDADGKPVYQGIDTSFMVAPLNAAMIELAEIVEAQAAIIEQLKARLDAANL